MYQVDLFNETEMTRKHDPGGKVRLALPDGTVGAAVFGGKRQEYRYRLSRTWDAEKPHVLFVMMNPSTADPLVDDPTVAKCGRFARAWRYGGVYVGNTFAYRTTDQKRLMQVPDPVGPENDGHLIEMAKTFAIYAGAVICFGGLIFAGIRMLSGRFQDAIPGLFGALFGAGVLGWGAGWIGSLTGQSM
jgi:hypothetical protein